MNEVRSILLVEDAGIIAEAMKSVLEESGHSVSIAHDAKEADALLDNPLNSFDLIITDLNLGSGPNGWEVASKARGVNATIPIIYLTGLPIDEWLDDTPKSLIIQKPVTAEGVRKAVAMFAEILADKHKSSISNNMEAIQFKLSNMEQLNRELTKVAEDDAAQKASIAE